MQVKCKSEKAWEKDGLSKGSIICMEKKTESTEGDKEGKKESRYLRREFSYSKFQQTLILPDDVDKDKIDAKVNDGVLTIELPKRTPEDKEKAAKVIEVK